MPESPRTVVIAIAVNVAIALAKGVASVITGSAAMTAEAIHSAVDAGNSALLFVGLVRAAKPADERHPFGYGREIYFWSMVVALVIFGAGGVAAIGEGIERLYDPHELQHVAWNYAVLIFALVFESISWLAAFRGIRNDYPGMSPVAAAMRSKDPSLFVVLIEDTAALAGLLIALVIGTIGATLFPSSHLDAIASLLIGALLIATALFLMNKTRSLLVGESADIETVEGIRVLLKSDPRVASVQRFLTAQMSPDYVLLNLELTFEPNFAGTNLPEAIRDVELAIRTAYPSIQEVFIEAQTPKPVEQA